MADLFGEIMGEAVATKGITMPAPPPLPEGVLLHPVLLQVGYPVSTVPADSALLHRCRRGPIDAEGPGEGLNRLH